MTSIGFPLLVNHPWLLIYALDGGAGTSWENAIYVLGDGKER
jgi:hypothetical protein